MDPVSKFKVGPLERYQRKIDYSQPKEVCCFSYDEQRDLHLNINTLEEFQMPPMPFNLGIGYPDDYIQRDDKPEHLDALLYVMKQISIPSVDICTWRGIMTKIMCTPYSNDDWELRVTRFRGIVYIEEHIRETPHHHDQDRNCYYGYKFEAICTSNGPVNTNVQFCSVFRTRLGSVRLLLGAEVDCLFQGQYAELKTNKIITSDRQHYNFIRFKLLKTWAQSFLAGVNHVIFGYRNDEGELQSIKTYATKEFPRMAREYNLWDPNVCLTFASKVLEFVQQNVSVDDANTVYTVAYSSKDKTISIHEPKHCDPFVK